MMGWLSFVWSYWQFLLIGTALVAVLAYVAFILKNWKVVAAAGALVGMALAAQALYSAGYNARVAKEVGDRTKLIQDRLDTLELVAANDKLRADSDAATIAILSDQVSKTPPNDKPAMPRDAVARIRAVK